MTTTFKIKNQEISKEYVCDQNHTISKLKENIIKDFNIQCKYIDIDFKLERAIRVLGKFNLEPGIIPRTLDNYPLNRFGIEGKVIDAVFISVDNYVPFIKKNTNNPVNLKKYSQTNIESGDRMDVTYKLESKEDFPPL